MAKEPGPSLWIVFVVGLIGFVLATGAGVVIAARAFEPKVGEPFVIPGSESRVLETGDYEILGLTGPFRELEAEPTFEIGDTTVIQIETGAQIPVQTADVLAQDLRDGESYDGVGSFTVEVPGTYQIDIRSDAESRALVERSGGVDWNELLVPFVFLGVGCILSAAASLMFFIGFLRRRAARSNVRTR